MPEEQYRKPVRRTEEELIIELKKHKIGSEKAIRQRGEYTDIVERVWINPYIDAHLYVDEWAKTYWLDEVEIVITNDVKIIRNPNFYYEQDRSDNDFFWWNKGYNHKTKECKNHFEITDWEYKVISNPEYDEDDPDNDNEEIEVPKNIFDYIDEYPEHMIFAVHGDCKYRDDAKYWTYLQGAPKKFGILEISEADDVENDETLLCLLIVPVTANGPDVESLNHGVPKLFGEQLTAITANDVYVIKLYNKLCDSYFDDYEDVNYIFNHDYTGATELVKQYEADFGGYAEVTAEILMKIQDITDKTALGYVLTEIETTYKAERVTPTVTDKLFASAKKYYDDTLDDRVNFSKEDFLNFVRLHLDERMIPEYGN